jgi:hypothetical protein
MGTSRCWQFAGLAALTLIVLPSFPERSLTAADAKSGAAPYKPVVPADTLSKLITEEGKALRDAVGKASDKKMASKARSIAFLIAVYAQDEALRGGSDAAPMVGLRDTALKIAKAVADGKIDEAKKLAADVKPGGVAGGAGKAEAVPVQEDFDIETLMLVFKPERGGGLEWEKKLLTLKDKRSTYTASDYQSLVPLMYRIATVAQPTEAFVPAPMGKKNPADWTRLSKEMGEEALAVAELAKKQKPDDKAVKAAVKRLEGTCASCHDKFRDAN